MHILSVSTHTSEELIDITSHLRNYLKSSGAADGILTVYCPHTTAGLTINENADPDVTRDILARLVPATGDYRHAEGNSDAHIKASLMGFTVTVPVIEGRLALGTWQAIYFCEFDGPRRRRLLVGVTGEAGAG